MKNESHLKDDVNEIINFIFSKITNLNSIKDYMKLKLSNSNKELYIKELRKKLQSELSSYKEPEKINNFSNCFLEFILWQSGTKNIFTNRDQLEIIEDLIKLNNESIVEKDLDKLYFYIINNKQLLLETKLIQIVNLISEKSEKIKNISIKEKNVKICQKLKKLSKKLGNNNNSKNNDKMEIEEEEKSNNEIYDNFNKIYESFIDFKKILKNPMVVSFYKAIIFIII